MVLSKIKPEAKPEHGDFKIERHFAWWPTKVDGFKIWMEPYKKVYVFKVRKRRIYLSWLRMFHEGTWGEWELIAVQKINNL